MVGVQRPANKLPRVENFDDEARIRGTLDAPYSSRHEGMEKHVDAQKTQSDSEYPSPPPQTPTGPMECMENSCTNTSNVLSPGNQTPSQSSQEKEATAIGSTPQLTALRLRGGANTQPRRVRGTQKRGKTTKASIKIAALNINGAGVSDFSSPNNKWFHINQLMREKRIGILAVGEAHLDDARHHTISQIHGSKLHIEFSTDPQRNVNSRGVAVIYNKNLVKTTNIKTTVIVPGLAILCESEWHNGETIAVLAIYAPNDQTESRILWEQIADFYRNNPTTRRPDLMAGDCNMVEAAIDRLPCKIGPQSTIDALDTLKLDLDLCDGWRETFPDTKAYSYMQVATGSQSRIDRIYLARKHLRYAFEWDITPSPLPHADHKLVSVRLTTQSAPETGNGRWTWPLHLLKDPTLNKHIRAEGTSTLQRMLECNSTATRTVDENPQVLWMKLKESLRSKARERAKVIIPKLDAEIREIQTRLDLILNDNTLTENDRKCSAAVLTQKLLSLEQKRHNESRTHARAKNVLQGETISRYWAQAGKPRSQKDVIQRLRINGTEPPVYTQKASDMADIARDYHNATQNVGPHYEAEVRAQATHEILLQMKPARPPVLNNNMFDSTV